MTLEQQGGQEPLQDAARKRELVRMVRGQRPGLDDDELRQILESLGVAPDDPVIAEELALEPEPYPMHDELDDEPSRSRRLLLGVVGVVVLVLVAGAGVLLYTTASDSDSDDTDTADAPASTEADGAPDTEATEPDEPTGPAFAPTGPGADPELDDGGDAWDEFTREGELGTFPGVGPWTVGRGEWQVAFEKAMLQGGDPSSEHVAFVDVGTPDVRAQVRLDAFENGAGLAFRVKDPDNFWLWAPVPSYGTMVLLRVENGDVEDVGHPGLTVLEQGMQVGVNTQGDKIELLANGVVVMSVPDHDPAPGTGLGIGVAGGGTSGTFDDLVFARND